jgi:hypothetical protein
MIERISCSCDGRNENCKFCGGSGIRPAKGAEPFFAGSVSPGIPPKQKKKSIDGSGSVPCRFCGYAVKSKFYAWHLKNLHDQSRASSASKQLVSNPDINTDLAIPNTSQEETRQSRMLDATREYAHLYREGGRYGSHSSHDRFDGDSNS